MKKSDKNIGADNYSFGETIDIYLAMTLQTQVAFAREILSNRQAVASLRDLNIEDLSNSMLMKLYYYFNKRILSRPSVRVISINESQTRKLEDHLYNLIAGELDVRINKIPPVNEDTKPRVRRRKNI